MDGQLPVTIPTAVTAPSSLSLVALCRLFARHRVVAAIGAVATLVSLVVVATAVPPKYESGGALLLLLPPAPVVDRSSSDTDDSVTDIDNSYNPYVAYGSLSVVSDVVARLMMSQAVADELAADGITDYSVETNADYSRGAVLEVEVRAPTAEEAQAGAARVLAATKAALATQQERYGTDPQFFITADELEAARVPVRVLSSTVRALIAMMALGGLLTCAAVLVAEAWYERRVLRDREASSADDHPVAP